MMISRALRPALRSVTTRVAVRLSSTIKAREGHLNGMTANQFWQGSQDQSIDMLYDEFAETYEAYVEDKGMASNAEVVRLMKKYWPRATSPAVNVLDVGCGTGLLGRMLLEDPAISARNTTFIGTDLSPGMLKRAADTYGAANARVWNTDKLPWPVAGRWADVTICNGVFIYLQNTQALTEFVRTTKPGGHCILQFRHDAQEGWTHMRDALEASGAWRLVEKTPDVDNFPGLTAKGLPETWFNVYVYEVLA